MKPKPPCHNCENRHIGCHAECEKYIDFRKKLDDYNEVVKQDTLERTIITDYMTKRF